VQNIMLKGLRLNSIYTVMGKSLLFVRARIAQSAISARRNRKFDTALIKILWHVEIEHDVNAVGQHVLEFLHTTNSDLAATSFYRATQLCYRGLGSCNSVRPSVTRMLCD